MMAPVMRYFKTAHPQNQGWLLEAMIFNFTVQPKRNKEQFGGPKCSVILCNSFKILKKKVYFFGDLGWICLI